MSARLPASRPTRPSALVLWAGTLWVAVLPFEMTLGGACGGYLLRALGAVFLLAWLVEAVSAGRRVRLPSAALSSGLLVSWGWISTVWAAEPLVALGRAATLSQLWGMYVWLSCLAADREGRRRLASAFAVGTLGACCAAVAYASAGGGHRASVGPAQDANTFAWHVVVALLLVVGFEGPVRRGRSIIAGALTAALVLTGSRTGFAALLAGVGTTVLLSAAARCSLARWAPVCAAAVLAVALLKPAVVASTGERLRRGVTLEDRLSRRLDVWRVARGIGREHPLTGVGLGNFRRQYAVHAAITPGMTDPYSAAEALEPHSVIIGTLAELGPGGLLLLLAFAVSVAGSARKAAGSPGAAWASVVGALAATTVVGLADDVLAKKATWSVLALATDTRAEPGGRPGGET